MNIEEMQNRRKMLAEQESDLLAQLAAITAAAADASGVRPQHQLTARLAVTQSAAAAYDVMIAAAHHQGDLSATLP